MRCFLLFGLENVHAAVGAGRDKSISSERLVNPVPPAPRRVIHAIGWFAQTRPNVVRVAGFGRKLAHNVTRRVIVFPLEESSLKVNVANRPPTMSSKLTNEAEARGGSRWDCRFAVHTSDGPGILEAPHGPCISQSSPGGPA